MSVASDPDGGPPAPRGAHDLTPEALCDRVSTFSAVLAKPPVARKKVLDAVLMLARDEAVRTGAATVRVAYVTRCLRPEPAA